jgi:lipooligosaccharide transport system ATP-binding protein
MTLPLVVNGVSKAFANRSVITELNFSLNSGECLGLLGPNGAGKSTTIKMILGHIRPSSGSIEVHGLSVADSAAQIRQKVGVVAQFDSLDPDFTVEENLWIYARYFGLSRDDIAPRMEALLHFAMLLPRRADPISTLSGGMKRRLSIARALVHQPTLILLDEPTTGLDPQARHLLWDRLKELKRQGLTILLTTHFMEEAERLCDRVAILDQGTIKAMDSPQALIKKTIRSEVVEIFGDDLPAILPELKRLQQTSDSINHLDVTGETCFCYTQSPHMLTNLLSGFPTLRYLHRPAHLEDVFLRLTGRDLRED